MITEKVVIHNEKYNRRISNNSELINFFLNNGWYIGYDKSKESIKLSGNYYHKDNVAIKLYKDIDKNIPEGFIKGNIERDYAYCRKVSEGKKAKKLHMYHDNENRVYWIAEGCSIPANLIKGSTDINREAASKANKGKEAWNKGLRILMKKEHRDNINLSQKRLDVRAKKSLSMKKTLRDNPDIILKAFETKKKNKRCTTSLPEEIFYNYLVAKYGKDDILRNYSDKNRYPHACDFYIKSIDKFIELNLTWCHGNHPYNPDNYEDLKKLECWKAKATNSKYYEEAINVWTKKDVAKLNIAKKNKLNYQTIYNEEWKEFIKAYDNK